PPRPGPAPRRLRGRGPRRRPRRAPRFGGGAGRRGPAARPGRPHDRLRAPPLMRGRADRAGPVGAPSAPIPRPTTRGDGPMKIRYIEPKPKGATIYEIANLPKLGLPLLAAQAREAYDDVDQRIYCELIRGVEVDWADVESADLVCISTTTNTTL